MAGNLNAIFHLNVPLYPDCLSWSLFGFWEITKRAVKPRGYVTNLALHAIAVPCDPGKNDKGRYRSLRVRFRPLIPTGHKSAYGKSAGVCLRVHYERSQHRDLFSSADYVMIMATIASNFMIRT